MPADDKLVVFAYGSNMLTRRLRKRCPSAIAIGRAILMGYAIRWHKRSTDGSGKCDVVQTADKGAVAHGVVFRIDAADKPALDQAEGLGHGYDDALVTVTCNGKPLVALMYRATDVVPSLAPYSWYKAMVIAGAREHGLPDAYIRSLESAAASNDPDKARHARNMTIVRGPEGSEQ